MKKFIFSVLLSGISCVVYADFDLANTYYSSGNFEKAYSEFLESAQYGDTDAQQSIGIMYYRGEFLPQNKILAYAWMTLATQNPAYKEKGLNLKIFNKLSEDEKKIATEEYQSLYAKFSDQAIQEKLTPSLAGQLSNTRRQRIIKSVMPSYPEDLVRMGKSGVVDITFSVDKYGMTRDQVVFYASESQFGKAALSALRKFQFEPLLVNGKPVDMNGEKVRFMFRIDGTVFLDDKIKEYIDKEREKATIGSSKDKLTFAYLIETIPTFARDYKLVDNPNDWYVNAANQGSFTASYFLGRNILYGNMCTADSAQSMGWLLKAARGGISEAQYLLAIESFSGARFEKNNEKGFYWLNKAASVNKFAKVKYAWILATHPDVKYRNGKLAEELLNAVEDSHSDKLSLYQARAAVAAETNRFADAIKWQKEALDDAKALKLPLEQFELQLASYKNSKAWREVL